jgi:FkbM family methyltransferase
MNKYISLVGDMFVRNQYDIEVIREVIDQDQYRRWGEITINEKDIVIDLGAHIGAFTRLALDCKANVIAVEGDHENFEILKNNTKGFNVRLLEAIVFDGNDVVFRKDQERGELNKVILNGVSTTKDIVKSITLDNIVDLFKLKKINLLKLDIEGSEYEVLYNFKNLDIVEQITMEWHYGTSQLAILILDLEKRGFKTVWLGGNGDWGHLQLKRQK